MRNLHIKVLATLLMVVIPFATSGCDLSLGLEFLYRATETVDESVAVSPGTRVEVFNSNGSIMISPGRGREIQVHATIRGRRQSDLDRVEVSISPGAITVIETRVDGPGVRAAVEYEIMLPPGVEASMARTSNGAVTLTGVQGDVDAESSNGNITITGVSGAVSARTSNGNIQISECDAVRGARTSNGNVHVEIRALVGDAEIRTSNGSITVLLEDDLPARVEFRTSNGRVNVEHDAISLDSTSPTQVRGTMGDGRYRLTARTSNGRVTVSRLE